MFEKLFNRKPNLQVKELQSNAIKMLGNQTATWLSFQNEVDYLKAYYLIPQLRAVIDNSAQAFASFKPKLYKIDSNGKKEEIKKHNILNVLKNPNPLQDSNEFWHQFYVYWQVFGNSLSFFGVPNSFKISVDTLQTIWNLPVQYVRVKQPNKPLMWTATRQDEIIKQYILENSTFFQSEFDESVIMHVNEPSIDFVKDLNIWGRSKIYTLQKPLSNILMAYEARNVLLKKRGAIGILSNEDRGGDFKIPLTSDEIKTIQNDFQKYGLSDDQWQVIITDANLKWQPMTMPIREMMLSEGIEEDTKTICDAYNYPILLLNDLSGSTFSNLEQAQKNFYLNKIYKESEKVEHALNKQLNTAQQNLWIELSYDHLPIMQSDEALETELQTKVINTIILLNEKLRFGAIDFDAALNILTQIYELPIDRAKLLLSTSKPQPTQTTV